MTNNQEMHEFRPALGIDLGTTFSAIARWDGRGPKAYEIRIPKGDTLQSAVFFDPQTQEFQVGSTAYKKWATAPENLATEIKRRMDDVSRPIILGGKSFSAIDLSAEILKHLYKDVAKRYPKNNFKSRSTVVTVPYYFKSHQCEHTRQAAEKADINCKALLQEPIAASLAYTWQLVKNNPNRDHAENILVFDLGGGTFDLTLFRLEQAARKLKFEVLAAGGDSCLGGIDFDNSIVNFLKERENISLQGLNLKDQRRAELILLELSNQAKHELSSSNEADIVAGNFPGKIIDTSLTRSDFEHQCFNRYLDKIEHIISGIWDSANLQPKQIDRVILVGGSSHIPKIRELLPKVPIPKK